MSWPGVIVSVHYGLAARPHSGAERSTEFNVHFLAAFFVVEANRSVNGTEEQFQSGMALSNEKLPWPDGLDSFIDMVVVKRVWKAHERVPIPVR